MYDWLPSVQSIARLASPYLKQLLCQPSKLCNYSVVARVCEKVNDLFLRAEVSGNSGTCRTQIGSETR